MRSRIYIDTSVIGGYYEEEYEEPTKELFKRFENDEIFFVVSDLLDLELTFAPEQVKNLLQKYAAVKFERITLTEEAMQLADQYIRKSCRENKP